MVVDAGRIEVTWMRTVVFKRMVALFGVTSSDCGVYGLDATLLA